MKKRFWNTDNILQRKRIRILSDQCWFQRGIGSQSVCASYFYRECSRWKEGVENLMKMTQDRFFSVLNSGENVLRLRVSERQETKIHYHDYFGFWKFENLGLRIHKLRDRITVALLRNSLLNIELWLVTGTWLRKKMTIYQKNQCQL